MTGVRDDDGPRTTAPDSQLPFQDLADVVPAMLWLTGPDGSCGYLSQGWYDFTGQTEAEGLGFGWLDALHPDDVGRARADFAHATRGQQPFSIDYRFRRHDGTYRWAIDAARPRVDADGAFAGFAGVVVDIDDRRRASDAAAESQQQYHLLFNAIDEGFCVIDVLFDAGGVGIDYRFVEVNPSFSRQTGLHDVAGRTAREVVPGLESHWSAMYGEVARTGTPRRFVEGSDAMGRWFDVYAFRIGDPDAGRVAILFNDISDRRRAEAALQDADRRKDAFLATLAHELRNPLAPIRTSLQVLRMTDDGDTIRRMHGIMSRQVDQLTRLVDDLMEVSRITRGTIALRLADVDLADIVAGAVESSRAQLDAAGHVLAIDLPDGPLPLRADAARLTQVLVNLLDNAMRFSAAGSRIALRVRQDGDVAVLSVVDHGVGIAAGELVGIFDAFTRLERTRGQAEGGLGVGLALVRSLVQMHGGTVEARSAGEGEGSVFVVRLPLSAPLDVPAAEAAAAAPPRLSLAGLRVLVVDDNRDAAESFGEWLVQFGADARVVHDGHSALAHARARPVDVVLLDLGMPEMDGFEVARRLRAQPGHTATTLVAITGWGQPGDRERTAAAGFDHHITKPPDIPALHALLAGLRDARDAVSR